MILEDIFGEKLKVAAFTDTELQNAATETFGDLEYELQINPKDFSRKVSRRYNTENVNGNTAGPTDYLNDCNEIFTLAFTLDTTGVTGTVPYVDSMSPMLNKLAAINPIAGILAMGTLIKSIDRFYAVCASMNPDTHQPNFIKILWKDLVFQGRLKSFDVKFTQFSFTGEPVRAEITSTFVQHNSNEFRIAQEGKNSPDLTHSHVVKKGDTLCSLAYKYYGDSKYYLDVAKFNGLKNFRSLKPGVQLAFPPLSKK